MKCTFENDKWGWYVTPLIGVDWTLVGQVRLWLGWGPWLWVWIIWTTHDRKYKDRLIATMKRAHKFRTGEKLP